MYNHVYPLTVYLSFTMSLEVADEKDDDGNDSSR